MLSSLKQKYIGDRAFYRMILTVALPIMLQNGITNFVSLLDNLMVGRLGTESMSGVSIINWYVFVFNLLIFGATSGAGIFTAQFFGAHDNRGITDTFRLKLFATFVCACVCGTAMLVFDDSLIGMFLHDGSEGDLVLTLSEARDYLSVVFIGFLPFAVSNSYASTMRETGEEKMPLYASIAAVAVNFVFNWLLIFGKCGLPVMGVRGAATATVLSRFVECGILVVWGHKHTDICPWLKGAYQTLNVPTSLLFQFLLRGVPLMLNEFFWALAVLVRGQCYALRGLDAVAAESITSTIGNLFNIFYAAMGSSIAIIVGNQLGEGNIEKAKDTDRKMVAFSVFCSVAVSIVLIGISPFFPLLYDTTDAVRGLSTNMIIITALIMPISAYVNAIYFTIRSGGKVLVTLLFDAIFMWVIVVPISMVLSRFTAMAITPLFFVCTFLEVLKAILGFYLVRRVRWAHQIVDTVPQTEEEAS